MSHFVKVFHLGKLWIIGIGVLFLIGCVQQQEVSPTAVSVEPTPVVTAVSTNVPPPAVVGPLVSVNTPVAPGETVGAFIDVDHPTEIEASYEWRIQGDTNAILDGQGTNTLLFLAPEQPGKYIVSVKVNVAEDIYHRSQLLTVLEPPTPTPINTPTPTAEPVTSTPANATHAVSVGSQLAEGYDMGVDSSSGQTDWVRDNDGHSCMAYPSGQDWGAVFITFGEPTDPPRPGQDLSGFQTLSLELRGESGGEAVWIGLKDNEDEDDGTETKLLISDLTEEWQTYTFPLSDFETADLTSLYVVTEFVFDEDTPPGTVCFRNIEYLPELVDLPTATAAATSTPTTIPTQEAITPTNTVATVTPTPSFTPTPSVSSHAIYVGSQLGSGYDMGVDSSGRRTDWVTDFNGYMCMAYPSGQDWGAVFITVGEPTAPPRPGQDLSQFSTLSLQLRGANGGEIVWVGLKDNTDADDGREVKIPVSGLTTEWQTYTFPLSSFSNANLTRLYVVTEFVFEPGTSAETVCFRNIQYLP